MKPIRLLTSMLAAGAVLLASCSAPRLAQQSTDNDDVYNSVAKAREYVQPAPSPAAQYKETPEDQNYGTSDPYYDMDYSSRINRFYYGTPFRGYYDPFYYDYYGYNGFSPWYSGFSLGFGWGWGNSYYGNYWRNPYYGWGIYSPYYAWNPFYGGGYLGGYYGGFYGGGGYYGGGYVNTLPGNTVYGARPDRSRRASDYIGRAGSGSLGRGTVRTNNGVATADRSRAERYNPNRGNTTSSSTGRSSRSTETYRTPQRTNTESRPTYSPPTRSSNGGSTTSSSGSSSSGSGSRSQRSGGRN